MRTARPLVPRSLLAALVSAGAATDTNSLTEGALAALAAPLWPLLVIIRLVAAAMRRSD